MMHSEVVDVLMCAECDTPLITTSTGGKYCMKCNFAPSMQDTYIQHVPILRQ